MPAEGPDFGRPWSLMAKPGQASVSQRGRPPSVYGYISPPAGAGSEQRLAVGGGAALSAALRPGGRRGLERGLDGVGDELRGLGA
jgi:hypothetical protein